jgi:hypothetical protein
LTRKFEEIHGQINRNVPIGQMIEPKGKGGLTGSDN